VKYIKLMGIKIGLEPKPLLNYILLEGPKSQKEKRENKRMSFEV